MPAKLVFGLKDGKSVQKEIPDEEFKFFLGKKVGDKLKGDSFGYAGYEVQIAGGSDYCGFPMRFDVPGFQRKKILAVKGIGLKMTSKGIKHRKTVCGNTVHPKIVQLNLKVLKEGPAPLAVPKEEKKEEAKAEEPKAKPTEAPKAAPTEAPKAKAEKPKVEEKKPEVKKEEPKAAPEKPKAEEKKPEAKPAEKPKEEKKPEAKAAEEKK